MSSTETIYLILFSTGFTVGFGHCLGMCGPIVASFSISLKGRGVFVPQLFYNVGRVTTYALLGGIMGVAGSITRVTAHIASLQKGVMVFAGVLIIVMGLAMAGWIPWARVLRDNYKPKGVLGSWFHKLSGVRSTAAYFPLGLLLGLLPCGPVYTALIAAARLGMETRSAPESFLRGMGLMLSFGLGTVPSLLLVAKLADFGWLKKRDVIYKVSSILMVILGTHFVIKAIK